MSDAKAVVDDLDHDGSSRRLSWCLHRTKECLEEGWDDTKTAPFADSDIKHAAIAVADVGACAVQAGLCMLGSQAL